ncbi:starry night [Carabus blaptoides fortunei]
MWKIIVTFSTQCRDSKILDSEHRLKIVYHHQKFNDTDIAKRVRRELRNQSPFFEQALYMSSVLEECDPGVVVTTVKARDPENSPVTYQMTSLLDSRTQGMFDIDSKMGTVTTKVKLDRELLDVHYFRVTAVDDSFPPRSGTTTLQINVIDANDHGPVFEMNEYDASVREGVSIGTTVITLKATDQDVGKNAEVEYSLHSVHGGGMSSEESDSHAFRVDSRTGVITTRNLLDRETTEVYTIIVQATDQASPQSTRRSSSATVVVHVLDDNDNYPQFTERTYTVNVNEDANWTENPVIAHVKATDADQGNNAAIRYAIIGGNTQSQFSIDSLTGDVSLVKPLDYESLRSYRLVIRSQDGGSPSRSNTTQLLINVKDINDNVPRFYTSLFQESVSESVPVGYSIVRVQAYDADEGLNSDIRYTLAPRDSTGGSTDDIPLSVDSHNGWIITTRELDREEQSKYMFQVIATDQGNPPLSASASVIVSLQDVNDNDPLFEPKIYEAVVSEDDQPGTPVASVTATDADEDQRLHYELSGGNTRGRFSITSQNGRGLITVAQPLDYKQEKRYILTVTASDSGGRHDTATVYVNVSDANNFAPVFEDAPYSASVFEDAPVGTTVLVVSATDNDVGINAQITYSLGDELSSATDHSPEFSINSQTGAIVTTKSLDRENISGYLLTVTAKDGGNPPLSDTTDIEISVTDVNDNYPTFKQQSYSGNILEDALIGTSVVQVSATDADIGLNGRIRYVLSDKDSDDGTFVIDPTSGVVRTNKGLDRESVAQYELQAIAVDRGSPALSSEVPVTIRIEDINDSPPAFDTDKIILYIPENSPIGSTVGKIHAADPDEGVNAIVQYSIIGGDDSNSFSLVTRPGSESAELLTMTELDYESPRKKYDLVVRAASPPLRSDVHVEVIVTDVNDNAPLLKDFHVMFNNFRDCFPTGTIGRIPAFDADVSDRLRYRILSGNNAHLVALNETTGELLLSPQLNTNVPKVASMEVSVTDGVNDVKAVMQLTVRLITEDMLFNSITVRLNKMTKEAFLSPLLGFFIDGLAAIIPCPKENIFLFSIQDDTDVNSKILNVSFSARRPDVAREEYYSPQFLQERVYLNRAILARLATVQVLPFDDNLCVREPCLNYEECLTVLKFGNASEFIHSDTVLFRPIYPVTTFACRCPDGFTGSKEHYLCDTEVNLCYSNPCKNNGTCYRNEGGYSCGCLHGFTGLNCEIILHQDPCKRDICRSGSTCTPLAKGGFICEDCSPNGGYEHYTSLCELKSRSFSKSSFLTFPSLRQRHRLHISLKFATQTPNGILLYNGRYNEKHDFISLEIVGGAVQFSFSLGSNVTRTKVTIPGGVADGVWHTVAVSYYNKTATVSLDDCDTSLAIKHGTDLGWQWSCANYSEQILETRCAVLTETCHRFLDLTGPLQIGGLPRIPSSFQAANMDYNGCISDLYVDHKFVDLNSFVADNGTTAGCPEKREFCDSNPCRNGGSCREGWSTYKCECSQGFGGKDCSDIISQPWRFSGDGTLSFNPLLRPIQLPWLNALSVRTMQADSFLMSVQVGQNSSAVVALKGGSLHYSYNGVSLNTSSKPLTDGSWHHLEITWLGTEVRLNVDYGQTIALVPFAPKIQGLYVGKILIGGPDGTYSSLNAGYSYFEGCIQDVRIGNQQSSLNRPTVRENVLDGCPDQTDCSAVCPDTADCVGKWGDSRCECRRGYVGPDCTSVCEVSPCETTGTCVQAANSLRGYECKCNSTEYSGEYCENKLDQPCPSGWWGYPVCGPCNCDVTAGYNPDCDKISGECRCKENHWRPTLKSTGINLSGKAIAKRNACLPCDCYATGSFSPQCDLETGQCRCRSGVIGQRCDSCPNPYAEVTLRGCEVVYDGCPRSYAGKLWWPRTKFGEPATEPCPKDTHGKASRSCDNLLGGWQKPDMFNCTSELFMELRKQLSQIEKGELLINTYVAVKMAADLHHATNHTAELYGADVLITQQLIKELLKHEATEAGLNLTHSQDKDYISNIVHSASVVLDVKYYNVWIRIEELTNDSSEALILAIYRYITILAKSQRDTYTNPFEIVAPNMALGLDVVTAVSLFGYEPDHIPLHQPGDQTYTTERVILPDTSEFLKPGIEVSRLVKASPVISFPKYNNYLKDEAKFDSNSKFLVPLNLLGIKPLDIGELTTKHSLSDSGAIISYAQYRQAGILLPEKYDESVLRRWGIEVCIGSPVISLSILVPEYVEAVTKPPVNFEQRPRKVTKKTFSDSADTKLENSAYLREETLSRRRRDEYELSKKLMYKSLSGIPLNQPIRIQLALDTDRVIFNERSNPQCVHWSTVRGKGEWSRVGCRTELDENWTDKVPLIINCTCNHLSSFAILVDVIDLEFVPEPSLLEDVSSYSCFSVSLPLLLSTWLILVLIRGLQTNSNTIHKNLVLCVFLAQLLYFVALKARRTLVENMFPCKLVAITLHYLWLCVFSWNLVDSVHLYRMLTEMRDINHGQMPFYFTMGYVLPAVVVSLPVGARVDQYGNYYFCWLSLYESVVWSLIGPVCAMACINLAVLALSIRAAFTLKDHVMGFGNLRTLLWLSVISLPLLVMMWVLALLMASDHSPMLTYLLSLAVLVHALFSILGYCFVNTRVRQNLFRSIMYCMGKKVPLLETTSVIGGASTSSHNINMQSSRSALAYHSGTSGFEASSRRHVGISTSSTTSRSTTKTGSSPYRSDTHLRHNTTSTSTSNYNSTSDVPGYLHRHREVLEESDRRRGDSESDSDASEGRSLELASSHSSDDDESTSTNRRHRIRNAGVSTVGYLPNITEHVVSRCGTPPALNIVTNSQLFPNIHQPYAGRWSSQLPEAYLPNTNVPEVGRWSAETASDNELHCHKTNSPNPLPNPDMTPDTYLPKSLDSESQYMVNTQHYLNSDPHYVHKLMKNDYHAKLADNFHEYVDHGSETEEKHHLGDKYLFPYTAEEDHCGTSYPSHQPSSRMMSPAPVLTTNDINNPPDYRMVVGPGSRIGSVMGSVCGGGSVRSSPSPLMPPVVSLMHSQQQLHEPEKDANAETSV